MIDVGSRYEAAFPSGVSHFLEKLAFNSTKSFTSSEQISGLLEKYGGMVDCQATKDTLVYAASCHISGVDQVMKLIADTTMRPLLTDNDLTITRNVVTSDVEMVNMKPEPEEILQDWIHALSFEYISALYPVLNGFLFQAAYRDNTLGFPKICPTENVEKIDRKTLLKFMKTYYSPKRMVVSGVGVSHQNFLEICDKYFQQTPTIWDDEIIDVSNDLLDNSVAQYTGGIIKREKDLSNVGLAINPFPTLAHFVLGLESCSYKDPDFVPFCVLNSLLGGGGSFSAGGPGKGMYTRLYLNVLNRCYWMYNAISLNLAYGDTGLFYIHAKQRPVIFEDICRQVLGHGYRKPPAEILEEIRRVTPKDVIRVADRMLSSKPAVVGYGNLAGLPDYEKIDSAIAKRDVQLLKPSRYFSWR
uniref:Alpha-MPP n=1 Tax=Romanomermis culicivorax TaxID=13658 RepID=A0A915IZX8_ROMCU